MGRVFLRIWQSFWLPMILLSTGILLWYGGESKGEPAPDLLAEPRDPLGDSIQALIRVPTGRALIEQAKSFWGADSEEELLEYLKWGNASRTDAVLTRHYDPSTGLEQRERKITVYLKEGQPIGDLILDMAHELVHATARPSWDPYDPDLTPGRYILAAIEGPGGEADALIMECRVGLEILANFGASFGSSFGLSIPRCQGYRQEGGGKARNLSTQGTLQTVSSGMIDRKRVLKDFYRVGEWGEELEGKLGAEVALFPLLSKEKPELYSSTGHSPYPVALFREFKDITQVACENSQKRLNYTRSPAADLKRFLQNRCQRGNMTTSASSLRR